MGAAIQEGPGPHGLGRPLRRMAGSLCRTVRALVDTALLGFRRRRAVRRVRGVGLPARVLFLCHGNVCRSPYAAARFQRRARSLGLDGHATSAGFIGPGRQPPEPALKEAATRGLDTSDHRSRVVTRELVEAADLVVVVEAGQVRRIRRVARDLPAPVVHLGDFDPTPDGRRDLPDPWGRGHGVFATVFDRIDRCVLALADQLRSGRQAGRPGPSVAEPGRSPGEG